MKLTEREAAELFREMTARPERSSGCLDDELLVRVGTDALNAQDREQVAAHIAQCSDCARAYRVARSMRPFAADVRSVPVRSSPRWWAAAAAAAVVVLSLAAWIWQAAGTIRDLRGDLALKRQELSNARHTLAVERGRNQHPALPPPLLGVPIIDVDSEPARGGTAAETTITLPPGAEEVVLVLHLPDGMRAPARVEVGNASGPVWSGIAQRIESGTLTIALRRTMIPPGTYAVRVRASEREAVFALRVTNP
jgi:hypothetical protein